jgi:hypothetical protein
MSSEIINNLHQRSNSELVEVISKLKIYFKEHRGPGFDKAMKTLGEFVNPRIPGGAKHMFDDSTLQRNIDKLTGTREHDGNLVYREYVIALIERACKKWEWDLNDSLNFTSKHNSQDDEELFPLEGNYYLYYSTSKENAIGKHPLHINHKGVARLALSLKGSKVIIEGKATYDKHNMLAIHFQREGSIFMFRYYMFSVMRKYPPLNLQRAYGLSIRTSHSMKPVARMEVLVFTDESIDSDEVVFHELPINSEEFIKEDQETKGLLTWLAGKLNRQIVAPGKPNETYSRRMEDEYVDIHFQAACYTALRQNFKESLLHLYQAYLHGFNKIELLKKEIEPDGCLAALYLSPLKAGTRHEKLYHLELTCKELVDKIIEKSKHTSSIPASGK